MRVKDIMTTMVLTIPEGTSVETAAHIMRDHKVGMLPVGDRKAVAGVVTDRDITVRVAAEARSPRHTEVREIMSTDLSYCFDDQDIEDACFMMEKKRVRRLLVFDRTRKLVGILSLDDIATRTRQERLVGYALSKVAQAA